jgi:MOSC domain-containing protein YiiM
VIRNGSIQSGDELKLIKTEENSLSLFDIASILFKDINNIEKMKAALDLKYLTEEIKERFRERLMKLGDFDSL